jgi:hypothetical protein
MIKTLRVTSAAAVVLAVVVLASVLGFLRPDALVRLNFGARSDKQIDKILEGANAVDRFKAQNGNKPQTGDTTPPLVKQANLFADIINPRAETPAAPPVVGKLPPKPIVGPKPIGPVSGSFDLLGTCYSDDPKASFAYIQLPDKTYQWARVGDEIGHVTIKEIRIGSIVCSDGARDVERNTQPTPETSCLLETGKAPAAATTSAASPAGGKPPVNTAKPASPVKPSVLSGRAPAPSASLPPAQIGKEEQENLSRLGSRLKAGSAQDANTVISEYKASTGNVSSAGIQANPGDVNAAGADWKKVSEEARRQWKTRLTAPRSMKK